MTKLVVDASVAIKWVIPETGHERARDLPARSFDGQVTMLAPSHLRWEVANALTPHFRHGLLTSDAVRLIFDRFESLSPRLVDVSLAIEDALDLSVRLRTSFWDSLCLALAIREDCVLVTADERLYRGAGRVVPNVRLLGPQFRI